MEQHVYREQAEVFHADLNRAYYRHLAGHDPGLPLEEIYRRHSALFTRQAVLERQDALQRAPAGSDAARSARMLWDFALEGHLNQLTTALEEEIARREVAIALRLPGESEPIGFRESPVLQANEPDAERRAAIESARHAALAEQLGDLHRQVIECQHATAAELGFASYRALCEAAKGLDLEALHAQTQAFSAATDDRLAEVLDAQLQRTLGAGHAALRRADIPRVRRAPADDSAFPADRLVSSFTATLTGLGIDPHGQPGVHLDLESRPGKTPRAFCAPVRVPDEVYLVLTPIGGREDYAILFHEAGHTQQFAHIARELPFEFRCLGDAAATETFAFLLQHVTDEPAWQRRHLAVADPAAVADFARVSRFLYLRQYAAKLAYELELHGGERPAADMGRRYAELLGAGLGVPWSEETFLSDVDPGFYSAGYLRAWAFEAQLRAHLRERFGESWWEVGEAGALLRELWRDGMRLSAEEVLAGLTGETLDFRILLTDLELAG